MPPTDPRPVRHEPVRYLVQFTARDLPGFLDMLRYDRPVVTSWDHAGDRFTAYLEGTRPTVDRWASFGLYPRDAATADRLL